MTVALLLVASYVLGSISASYLAGRRAGVDLRARGSGNLGATNVYRVLGWRWALPVVFFDVAKGFVPAWFFPLWDGSGAASLGLAYGLCAVAGHVWPVFLRFRGGKGVATAAGVVVAVAPFAALLAAMVWIGLVLLARIVSVASLAAATSLPVIAFVTDASRETVVFLLVLVGLVWWTHRGNVLRLVRGTELGFEGSEATAQAGAEPRPPEGPVEPEMREGEEEGS